MSVSPGSGRSGVLLVMALLAVGTVLALFAGRERRVLPPVPPPSFPRVAPPPPPPPVPPSPPSAPPVVLRGQVVLSGEIPERGRLEAVPEGAPFVYDPRTGTPQGFKLDESLAVDPETRGVANAVLWVKGVAGGAGRPEATVDTRGCQFVPHVALLTPGGRLTLLNPDALDHQARWRSQANPPGSLRIGKDCRTALVPGEAGFPRPEFIPLTCDAHRWMGMWVAVVDSGHAVVTDEKGRFSIPGVPPGGCTLVLWHETLAPVPVERALVLGSEGGEVRIPLSLAP